MTDITAQEVLGAIENKEQFVLLDVRTPTEFSRGKIDGAINIPVDDVPQMVEQVIPDKNTTIYVYCLSASRSLVAVDVLKHLGYNHAYNMVNGLMAWRFYNYPMI